MSRDQTVGIIWVVVAMLYGMGAAFLFQGERWFLIGGAAFIALMAVTIPVWRQWLPNNPES